jgi:hypothetical protein
MRLAIAGLLSALSLGGVADAATSLSGAWWFGDYAPEPKERVMSVGQRCWQGGVDFTLTETGTKLTGLASWIQPTGGVARPPRQESEALKGTREGTHIVLIGQHRVVTFGAPYQPLPGEPANQKTTVKYELRLDPKSGHLVGTRDGKPLWLARFKVHQAPCGPSPP